MQLKNKSIKNANKSIDKLGFFSIVIHIYYSVVWSVSYYTGPILFIKNFFYTPGTSRPLFTRFFKSRSNFLLLINSFLFATLYIYSSPVSSNNKTTAFFLSILIIFSILKTFIFRKSISFDRNKIFYFIQGPGKLILVFMYFFGIYHKLNTDFSTPL